MFGITISRATKWAAIYSGVSAAVNVALNVALIPLSGQVGSAIATAVAFGLLAYLYYRKSQQLYPTPYEPHRVIRAHLVSAPVFALGLVVIHPVACRSRSKRARCAHLRGRAAVDALVRPAGTGLRGRAAHGDVWRETPGRGLCAILCGRPNSEALIVSSLADQHVLVTGGGGFVGAPTVRALLEQGARVRVLDFAEPWRLEGLDCEVVIGDIADQTLVERACDGVDAVAHLAVLPLNQANTEPVNAFETNVRGSFKVFDAAGRAGVRGSSTRRRRRRMARPRPTRSARTIRCAPMRSTRRPRPPAEMLLRGLVGRLRLRLRHPALHERLRARPACRGRARGGHGAARRRAAQAVAATAPRRSTSSTSRTARTRTGWHSRSEHSGEALNVGLGRGDVAQ